MDLRRILRESRAGAAFLTGGVALTGIYFLVSNLTAQSVIYDGIGIAAACAIAAGVVVHRPHARLPWLLFALGNLCSAAGDIVSSVLENRPVPSAPRPLILRGLLRPPGRHRPGVAHPPRAAGGVVRPAPPNRRSRRTR